MVVTGSASTSFLSRFGFGEFIRFTRLHEWHPGKLPLLLAFAFTLLLSAPTPRHEVLWFVLPYLLTTLYLAVAYMLNNVADAEQDRLAGKSVGMQTRPLRNRLIPIILLAVTGFGIGVPLLSPPATFAMTGCYVLAWIYSFPPRLKEHTVLGPLVAAFAQIPAPALTLAVAWGSLPPSALAYLMVAFLYGLRMIMVHQVLDCDNDRLTGTQTTATVWGIPTIRMLLRVLFGLEVAFTAIYLVLVVKTGLPLALMLCLLWPAFLAILHWRRGGRFRLDSYSYIPLADVHESLLPLLLAVGVATKGTSYAIIGIPLVAILFLDRHLERLVRPLYPWRATGV